MGLKVIQNIINSFQQELILDPEKIQALAAQALIYVTRQVISSPEDFVEGDKPVPELVLLPTLGMHPSSQEEYDDAQALREKLFATDWVNKEQLKLLQDIVAMGVSQYTKRVSDKPAPPKKQRQGKIGINTASKET